MANSKKNDDSVENTSETMEKKDEFNSDDDIIDQIAEKNKADMQKDEFYELDEFGDDGSSPVPEPEKDKVLETKTSDNDKIDTASVVGNIELGENLLIGESQSSPEPKDDSFDKDKADQVIVSKDDEANASLSYVSLEMAKANASINKLHGQIDKLWTNNISLRQQVSLLSDSENHDNDYVEEIQKLQKEQRSARNSITSILDNEGKQPVLTHLALGLAIISLCAGIGAWVVGSGNRSDVTELSAVVLALEEEIEPSIMEEPDEKITEIEKKIKMLINQNEYLNNQIGEVNTEILTKKPLIDDLLEQKNQSKIVIERLEAKVKGLESRKRVTKKVKKVNKESQKNWAVNLVSFRQQWFADSKASEFKKKNVSAEVVQVKINGEDWFRLRVGGFNTKDEAAEYAREVKKTLNLDSVWVAKN